MSPPSWFRFLLVILAATMLAGCRDPTGPESFRTTTIRGRVHWNGRPIGPGWLEIMPVDGTLGLPRSAPVAADGSFVADGVPVGRVAIRLAGPPPPPSGDRGADRFLAVAQRQHLIHKDIPPAPEGSLDLDLVREKFEVERKLHGRF